MIGQHDNRYLRPNLLDLIGDGCAIEETQVVLEDNGIDGPGHEKPQPLGTVGGGFQLVSVFLQQTKLNGIPMYTQ